MPNKVYANPETTVYFADPTVASGGNVVAFSPAGLAYQNSWQSEPRDLGEFPRATLFRWRAKFRLPGGYNGSAVELYWSSFDSPAEIAATGALLFPPDGNVASGNMLMTNANSRRNMTWVGSVETDMVGSSGVPQTYSSSGLVQLQGRYGVLVATNNNLYYPLDSGVAYHGVSLTPVPDEIQ